MFQAPILALKTMLVIEYSWIPILSPVTSSKANQMHIAAFGKLFQKKIFN